MFDRCPALTPWARLHSQRRMSRRRHDRRSASPNRSDANRHERVATDVHAVLARTLHEEVKDPRVSDVSITAVRMSRDLSIAHVNVVPLGGQGDSASMMEGLQAASGFLRHTLGQKLRMRHTPDVHFHLDEGLDESLRLTRMLREMEDARSAAPDSVPDSVPDSAPDSAPDEGDEE